MSKPLRVYTTTEISVEWRPEKCIHCGNCKSGLPEVFNPSKRPWVDLSKATTEEIKQQVSECPSGALSLGK